MNIAITGMGIVSALGIGCSATLSALRQQRSGIGPLRHLPSSHTELPVGEVPLSNSEMKQRLGIADGQPVNRTALMAMIAVSEALEDAALNPQSKRIAFVNGTTVGGMDLTEQAWMHDNKEAMVRLMDQHDPGGTTRLIASHFGFFSEQTTLSTACSSAANAIALGARMLLAGEADVVVAGGSEALSLFHLNGFRSLMILDPQTCRPFSADRAGLNLGEGAAYVIMQRDAEDARAWLVGWGNACDAFHQTATSTDGEGATRSMQMALQMSGLCPADIDYVNAHGTGTPNNDQSESAALRRVFGGQMPPVSSTKGLTGHTTSASGSIETVICLLAMQEGLLPGNAGWRQTDADCIKPIKEPRRAEIRHVLCNSFGFGGNDTSVVFSAHRVAETAATSKVAVVERARVEISEASALDALRKYLKPMEARRMGRLMRSSLLCALRALEQAQVEVPDAIIAATAWGCLSNSEQLLDQLSSSGEHETLSPTLFMQSTHNTLAGNIAIRLGCHGYNVTYSHGDESLDWALRDASSLIACRLCRNVLVVSADEATPRFQQLAVQAGMPQPPAISTTAILLSHA